MQLSEVHLPPNHQTIVDRFRAACQADARILAAFIGGSYARGAADEYSDLDLYVILADEALADFAAHRADFLRLLGEPIFIEDFDRPNLAFYFFANGTEGELQVAPASDFTHLHNGLYVVLVDKQNLLANVQFAPVAPDPAEQTEKLRRLIYWFWHDLSHFLTALGRGQLWWAGGQLEVLRRLCVSLARLRHNFSDTTASDEPYYKIEKALPVAQLAALRDTFCPLEKAALLQAGLRVVQVYQTLAKPLAQAHAIPYPIPLEELLLGRLETLQKKTL